MPGSFLTDDLAALFRVDHFGEEPDSVVWEGNPISGAIFDDEDVEVQLGEGHGEIVHRAIVTAASSEFPGIADGDSVVVRGVNYTVANWMDDGSGMIEIHLERAP